MEVEGPAAVVAAFAACPEAVAEAHHGAFGSPCAKVVFVYLKVVLSRQAIYREERYCSVHMKTFVIGEVRGLRQPRARTVTMSFNSSFDDQGDNSNRQQTEGAGMGLSEMILR